MTMDEKLRAWNLGGEKEKIKIEKEGTVQSFGGLINIILRPPEAVHSTKRTVLKTGKKFSVLHK